MNVRIDSLEQDIQYSYSRWRNFDLPSYLMKELHEMKVTEILDCFYQRPSLGTEGIISKVGVGTNRLNIFTVRHICQALSYEIVSRGLVSRHRVVVIAYDSRLHSRSFAEQAALVLANNNIKVYLFDQPRPASELAFSVRWLHAIAGMNFSAGRLSPQYHGMQIFSDYGCLVSDSYIARVQTYMDQIGDGLDIEVLPAEEAIATGKLVMVGTEIDKAYIEYMENTPLSRESIQIMGSSMRVVLAPLFGMGGKIIGRAFAALGYTEIHQAEISDSTVSLARAPDPYQLEVLLPAYQLARTIQADIVLGFNPEENELSLSVKDGKGGYLLLHASQTAALMLQYIIQSREAMNSLPLGGIVVKTLLCSDLLNGMAADHGLQLIEATQGFQGIGAKMAECERTGKQAFVFGFDEYGGYALGNFVRGKDGIHAALLVAEMAANYKTKGSTVYQELLKLYEKYGWFAEERIILSFADVNWWQQSGILIDRISIESPMMVGGLPAVKFHDYRNGEVRDLIKQGSTRIAHAPAYALKFELMGGSWYGVRIRKDIPEIELVVGSRHPEEKTCKYQLSAIRSDVLHMIESII